MLCLLVLFNGLELDLPVPLCYFTHIIHAPTRTTSIRKYKDLNVYKDDVFLLPRSVLGVEVFTYKLLLLSKNQNDRDQSTRFVSMLFCGTTLIAPTILDLTLYKILFTQRLVEILASHNIYLFSSNNQTLREY